MRIKDERILREQIVDYGRELLRKGLVQGTWGNISIKLSNNYMLTTPSGFDYNDMTPSDVVKVAIKTLTYGRGNKPTAEKGLHAGIYERRPEVGAVIHTHSTYCSVFAAAHKPLQIEDPELAKITGELLYVADHAFAGTKALTQNALKALGDRAGCIMSNHGMVCCGSDIEDAFSIALAIEKAAESYIESRFKKLNNTLTTN